MLVKEDISKKLWKGTVKTHFEILCLNFSIFFVHEIKCCQWFCLNIYY